MRCENIQELFSEYWDWPESDLRRRRVDEHIGHCLKCEQEFRLWQESSALIKEAVQLCMPETIGGARIADRVMNRIYREDSWRMPVHRRVYRFSRRLRRRLTLVMSFFLAAMSVSLFAAIANPPEEEAQTFPAIMPVATAGTSSGGGVQLASGGSVLEGMPVASISDPLVLRVGPAESGPNYWMVLSLLGIVVTLLIMNWLSRIRA